MSKEDVILRAVSADGKVRAVAIESGELVKKAQQIHRCSPIATAALGRLLSAAALMSTLIKNESEQISVGIKGDGPLGYITAVAEEGAKVRGYVGNRDCPSFYKEGREDKLDVGKAVGSGYLTVVRSMGLKEPYVSQSELIDGEIASDIAGYYLFSEQVPTILALGVKMRPSGVSAAGGILIQLLPGAEDDEELIAKLEERAMALKDISSRIEKGETAEGLLKEVLADMQPEIIETEKPEYYCPCSRERMLRGLRSLQKEELKEIAESGEKIETQCQFCNKTYEFEAKDLLT